MFLRILIVIFILVANACFAQNWQSMNYSFFSNVVPSEQFIINQYTNDIWLVNDFRVGYIESSGVFHYLSDPELGPMDPSAEHRFTFTRDSVFFKKDYMGVYSFANNNSVLITSQSNNIELTSNVDSVFFLGDASFTKYYNGILTETFTYPIKATLKNSYLYSDHGVLGHVVGYTNQFLQNDPDYLLASITDKKFQRHTDSIYVSTSKGLMIAFNYDILDTITPYNTTNMPSPNVLEFEFDENDNIWAVFGDNNDQAFALAKLEGSMWTNIFNNGNCPINFTSYLGLEIDTLGNIWVADEQRLHTLLSSNSPQWLGEGELSSNKNIFIYPNPSAGLLNFSKQNVDFIEIVSLSGELIQKVNEPIKFLDLSDLENGTYLLRVHIENEISILRWVKI